ncbi:MAG: DUF4382 domain-containing protein [Nitrospiraceae bacterium]|nr:MAG: DUF4382 domain-containing protein [Nitrospiraceae bacterium]
MNLSRTIMQRIWQKIIIPVMLLMVFSVMIYACSGITDEKGVLSTSNSGTLYITDDLNTDYHQVISTIYRVEVEKTSDGSRLQIFNDELGDTYDLRNLNGILAKLSEAFIPAGMYNRVIITVGRELILVDDNDVQMTPNPELKGNKLTSCDSDKCTIEIPGDVNVAHGQKVIVDFDLKQFKYDPVTNRVTAKVVVDVEGSKYRDYLEMKEDDYKLKGIINGIGTNRFEVILKRARQFMPEKNIVTVLVDTLTQYVCDDDDNVKACLISSFDDLEKGMKVELHGTWNGQAFEAEKIEIDEDDDLFDDERDNTDLDDYSDGDDGEDGDGNDDAMHSRFNWNNDVEQHQDYVDQSNISECTGCHNIEDKDAPLSCLQCHGDLLENSGQITHSNFGWTDANQEHGDYVDQSNISECTGCHNIEDRNAPLHCLQCHGNLWDKDGSTGHRGWSNVRSSHQSWSEQNSINECLECHNTSSSDRANPLSCYHCHGREW